MILAACFVASCLVPAAGEIDHPVHAAAIEKFVRKTIDGKQVPGISVAVLEKGALTHARGYGFAELEHEVPMRADSICRIASVTKQFTAAGILKLVERDELSLDDPFGRYVDGFGEIGEKATIRQLLHHTSGVADFTRLGEKWHSIEQLDRTPDQLMDLVRDEPPEFEPGARWAYDNSGYLLLGMVIEEVTGVSYAEFVENDLLKDLGLSDTRHGDDAPILKRRAQGYRLRNGVVSNDELKSMTHPHAAGAIVSTAIDLVRWSDLLADGKVVSAEAYAQMTTPGELENGESTGYGFGLTVGDLEGRRVVSHNGGIHGFSSRLAHYPDADLHVAVLINCDFAGAADVEEPIARALLGIPQPEIKDLPITDDEFEACVGKYEGSGMTILIRTDGSALTIVPSGKYPARLMSQGELRFVADAPGGVSVEFDRETSPAGHFVLKQRGKATKFTRTE